VSLEKFNFDKDFLGRLNSHQAFQEAFVRVNIDQPFVYAHLPAVPRMSALSTGTLSGWDPKPLSWQGDGSAQLHTRSVGDLHDLAANAVQALRVGA